MDKRGITLIELLIVTFIIGVLAVIAIPSYIGQQKRAARSEAYSNLESLRLLEEQFFAENGEYAPAAGGTINYNATPGVADNGIEDELPGFQPGTGISFNYAITQNVQITGGGNTTANPPTTAPLTPCFVAIATGIAGTRVAGDVFAIDCRNNRNF